MRRLFARIFARRGRRARWVLRGERHVVVGAREGAGQRYGAALCRATEAGVGFEIAIGHDLVSAQNTCEVRARQLLKLLEERGPLAGVVEPVFPARVELLLEYLGKPPERNAARGLEDFRAPVSSYREHGSCLREAMRAREAAPQGGGSEAPELALGVPPLGEVHLTEACDQEAKLQQPIEIKRCSGHRVPPFAVPSWASAPPARTHSSTSEMWNFQRSPVLCAGRLRGSVHR
jgi:hypothetical protein